MSADADPHYQKLYGRVTDVCSNRRGQPNLSAMKEPHPGRNPSLIRFASPSGKYALAGENSALTYQIFYITCGWNNRPSTSALSEHDGSPHFQVLKFIAPRPNGQDLAVWGGSFSIKETRRHFSLQFFSWSSEARGDHSEYHH